MATFQLFFQSGRAKDLSAPCIIYEDGRTNYDVSVETWIESRPVKLSVDNGLEEKMM